MARTGQPAVRHVAAVERALAVLDALADGGELGTNELARRTGINASTVSRLLATLAARGLVEHVAGDRPLPARPAARPARQRRARRGSTCASLRGRTRGARRARPARRRRSRRPASTTRSRSTSSTARPRCRASRSSAARASATRPRREGAARLRGRRSAGAAARRVHGADDHDPRAPRDEIERVRRRGLAEARGEREEELNAIAAPVRDSRGELVGILGIQGPSSRFDTRAARSAVPPFSTTRRHCLVSWVCRHNVRVTAGSLTLAPLGEALASPALHAASQTRQAAARARIFLRELGVGALSHSRPGRARPRAGPASARRRARGAPRSAAGCTAVAGRPRPPGPFASAAGSRSASSTSSRADVLVPHRERDRPERHLGGVDDDQRLPRLDGRVDGERRRLRLEGDVERDEHHRVGSRRGPRPLGGGTPAAATRITRVGAPSSASA